MNNTKRKINRPKGELSNQGRKSHFSRRTKNSSRGKAKSTLDPSTLIQKAKNESQDSYTPTRSWEQMPISAGLKSNLSYLGFTHPTQIQEMVIDPLMQGRDLIGIAKTGTGKTAAFLMPLIEQLRHRGKDAKALVVVPTRELALQVEQEFSKLSRGMGLRSSAFVGGTSVDRDVKRLRQPSHLIVGTPGRLLDLQNRNVLGLKKVAVLVLDEFDRMLDMGFVSDVLKITNAMSNREQTLLFSATLDPTQEQLIDQLLHNPLKIKVSSGAPDSNQVEQDIIRVNPGEDKFRMLLNLVSNSEFEKVLLFAETKRSVDRISKRLTKFGIKADMIHGNKSQNYRNRALEKFKQGKVKVLVATDVAARGIDVFNVTHVINYQLPLNLESYTHRIGRTGRAGKTGKAFTFVD